MATDPYAKKPTLRLRRRPEDVKQDGDVWNSTGSLNAPLPGPGASLPSPAAPAPQGLLAGVKDYVTGAARDLNPARMAKDVANDPMGSFDKTMAPLAAGAELTQGLRAAGGLAGMARMGRAGASNPQLVNEVRGVVDNLPAAATAARTGLRGVAAVPALVGAGMVGAAALNQEDTAPPEPAPAPANSAPAASPLRYLTAGRDANNNLVASSEGPQDVAKLGMDKRNGGKLPTGLRSISFSPETQADVDKQHAASDAYYKNIGGGVDVQMQRLSQNLSDAERPGTGTLGLRGAGTGTGADTPLDLAKFMHEVQKDDAAAGQAQNDALDKDADRVRQDFAKGGVDLTDPLASATIEAQALRRKDPNLETPAGIAMRQRLQAALAQRVEGRSSDEKLSNDPNVPYAPRSADDFSGFSHGDSKGLRALTSLGGLIGNERGTLQSVDANGNVFRKSMADDKLLANEAFSNTLLSLLNELGAADKARKTK